MDAATLILMLVVLFFAYMMYSGNKLQKQILCLFRYDNKTQVEKFVSFKEEYVIFDKRKYDVVTKYIQLRKWNRGIHMFFPILVPSLDYTSKSRWPLNPDNFETEIDNPATRKKIDRAEDYRAFGEGVNSQVEGKKKAWERYLPWIAVGLTIVVAVFLYTQISGMADYMNTQFQNITNTINALK